MAKKKRDRRQRRLEAVGAAVGAEANDSSNSNMLSTPSGRLAASGAAVEAPPSSMSNTTTTTTHPPCRDHSRLFASSVTYQCATQNLCVPCAYKICTFDVALDTAFTKMVPNARPESCPRSSSPCASACGRDGTMGYQRGMSVLTVGDGDLTFSLAVARIIFASVEQNQRHQNSGRLAATSYESKDTLLKVYPNIGTTIQELESLGATVCYQVDATNIAGTLPNDVLQSNSMFDRITWNFPCSAIGYGQDGQNDAMEFNKQLIRDYVGNAVTSRLVDKVDGEIHMLHKTKPPFNQWHIETVALEALGAKGDDDDERSLEYKGRIAFDRCLMPPYVPRKALDKKSFTCHDACTYVFGWSGGEGGAGGKKYGCTIPLGEDDGCAEPLLAVTEDMIISIRHMHLNVKAAKMAAGGGKDKKWKKRRRK